MSRKRKIPADMEICHHCDNKPCVSPKHLYLGTHQDNANDVVERAKQSGGEDRHSAKITEDDVREIFELYEQGMTQRQIGFVFDIQQSQVSRILNRKRWTYLPIAE